jgi:hypothetical protein
MSWQILSTASPCDYSRTMITAHSKGMIHLQALRRTVNASA